MVERARIVLVGATTCVLFLCMTVLAIAQDSAWEFKNYTTADGLTQTSISAIHQDSQGFIWLGSQIGLNRFDGINFTSVELNSSESGGSIQAVNSICEDELGNIWVGTNLGGMFRHNPRTGDIEEFIHKESDPKSLSSNSAKCVWDDIHQTMLVVHESGFIQVYNDGEFELNPLSDLANQLESGLLDVHLTRENEFWLIGIDGSYIWVSMNPDGQIVGSSRYKVDANHIAPKAKISSSYHREGELLLGSDDGVLMAIDLQGQSHIVSFFSSPDLSGWAIRDFSYLNGEYFLSTFNGLWKFEEAGKNFHKIKVEEDGLCDKLLSIYLDKEESFWIGGEGCGFYKQVPGKSFEKYLVRSNKADALGMAPWSFSEDPKGGIWIGTTENGISKFHPIRKSFQTLRMKELPILQSDQIFDILIDSENTFWIAGSHGLMRFDLLLVDGEYQIGELLAEFYLDVHVWEFIQDSRGDYWLGTEDEGVKFLDADTKKITTIEFEDDETISLVGKAVHSIYEDKQANLWIGTYGSGLLKYDPVLKTVKYFTVGSKEFPVIDNNTGPIIEDREGKIWIGSDNGIARYHEDENSWTHYSKSNSSLPDDTIYSFELVGENQLWITTNLGISRLDLETQEFTNYGIADGLQDLEFNFQASIHTQSGQLYFGGPQGINIVDPRLIQSSQSAPSVSFTLLTVLNEEIEPGKDRPIAEYLPFADQIELRAEENFFEIDYVASEYAHMGNYYFQYRLDGFDNEWIDNGQQGSLSYTNLDPGNYVLKVRASVGGRFWNPLPSTLEIKILPPWYQRPISYLLWFFLAVSAIYSIIYLVIENERKDLQKSELERQSKELERERATNDRLRELDKLKSVFLANMSHEIRTPLTSIIGFADYLSESLPDEHVEYAQYILNGGQRLMDTINSVLDLAQLEGKAIELQCEKHDLNDLIPLFLSVFGTSENVNINVDLKFENRTNGPIYVFVDQGALQRIVINLVGNALKFTKEGSITVSIDDLDGVAKIAVEDTGEGIDEAFLPDLFQMFSQESKGANRLHEGSGLGLAITKQLVDLMNGSITVQSIKGEGSTFTVNLEAMDEATELVESFMDNQDGN